MRILNIIVGQIPPLGCASVGMTDRLKWCENNPQDTLQWNGGFGRNDMRSFLQSILKTKCTFLQIFVSFYEKIRKNAQKYEKICFLESPEAVVSVCKPETYKIYCRKSEKLNVETLLNIRPPACANTRQIFAL